MYQAQILISKGDFEQVIELLLDTFKVNPRLCTFENYIVYILSILKKLSKVTKKGNERILECIEIIEKSNASNETKSTSIQFYMADILVEFEHYKHANKIYESLMNSVSYHITLRVIKMLRLAISLLNILQMAMIQGNC